MILIEGEFSRRPGKPVPGVDVVSRCLRRCACFIVVGSTLLGARAAHGATIRDDQPDGSYLGLALSPEYSCVGAFVNNWGLSGSATLIAPDWVLTAGHMVTAANSATFTLNGTSYAANQLIGHPQWNSANKLAGHDFGLAHLVTPVAGVAPAVLYTGSSERGQIGTYVGYGLTGTGLTGYRVFDGQKRAFQNMIDGDFGTPAVLYGSDFDNPHNPGDNGFGSPLPLTLEGCVAPGDSGGGVFVNLGGETYLAGVVSFVASLDPSANADYGDASGFGRVSAFLPWISNYVPEPSAASLFVLGAGVLSWVRSRARVPRTGSTP